MSKRPNEEKNRIGIQFRKLNDPNDSITTSTLKKWFRYTGFNLFMVSPLAPAHDMLTTRALVGSAQACIGMSIMTRYLFLKPNASTFRRSLVALMSGFMTLSGAGEVYVSMFPLANPWFLETSLARKLAMSRGEECSWWSGPPDFMPMSWNSCKQTIFGMAVREDLWRQHKNLNVMKVFEDYLGDYQRRVDDSYGNGETLGNKINKIIDFNGDVDEDHRAIGKDELGSIFGALKTDIDSESDTLTVEAFWYENHPWTRLLILAKTMYLSCNVPRFLINHAEHVQEESEKDPERERDEPLADAAENAAADEESP